jgi:hypothetical protein
MLACLLLSGCAGVVAGDHNTEMCLRPHYVYILVSQFAKEDFARESVMRSAARILPEVKLRG